ncbi:MAG TPA: FliG C-terminal domain-containing protein [Beijerinckiaceae bacterium]|nr:FliG C-terminal domain-containing protein [Beijerinckiaceae bacterium]
MRPANGAERAALVLLALGETHGAPIWAELDDEEAALLSRTIARLGPVDRAFAEAALDLFRTELDSSAGLTGTPRRAEELVSKVLPEPRAAPLLEQLRRPNGLDLWEKLATLSDQVVADYLSLEHPQTVSVILWRMNPNQSARVLARLPDDLAVDCLDRMTRIDAIEPAVVSAIEATLTANLVEPHSGDAPPEPTTRIADIFNVIDKRRAEQLLSGWRGADAATADRVREQMFTFEDFRKLGPATMQTLMKGLDKDLLALALKASPPETRSFFMDQLSARAARMLDDQISSLGAVRLREAQAAQFKVIAFARELEAAGELSLRIAESASEEMVE